jgi:acetyl esterase/lipase
MFRWLLLSLALGALVLGALNVFKSPDWSAWKLALIAGEFGYFFALVPLLVGGVAWFTRGSHAPLAGVTLAVGIVAFALLLKPLVQAARIGRSLPGQLTRDFGRIESARSPFSAGRLFASAPAPVAAETMTYAAERGLVLDFYRPLRAQVERHPAGGPARGVPCIVLVHGGGWDGGARSEIAHFTHWLASLGYAVASIDYRLAPKFQWPAQRDDITAAIAFLKSQATSLGIDATRLVLLGRSAGGHLAEATAYTKPDPAIRGVVALYAPADVHFAWEFSRDNDVLKSPQLLRNLLGGTPATARATYDSASPIQHVDKATPPTLLIHGQLDTPVWHRQSERLAQKLTETGVPHSFLSLPWATHAFEYNLNGPGGQLTTYAVEWFLAAVTR